MRMMNPSQQKRNAIERYSTAIHDLERHMAINADNVEPFRILTIAERIQRHQTRIGEVRKRL